MRGALAREIEVALDKLRTLRRIHARTYRILLLAFRAWACSRSSATPSSRSSRRRSGSAPSGVQAIAAGTINSNFEVDDRARALCSCASTRARPRPTSRGRRGSSRRSPRAASSTPPPLVARDGRPYAPLAGAIAQVGQRVPVARRAPPRAGRGHARAREQLGARARAAPRRGLELPRGVAARQHLRSRRTSSRATRASRTTSIRRSRHAIEILGEELAIASDGAVTPARARRTGSSTAICSATTCCGRATGSPRSSTSNRPRAAASRTTSRSASTTGAGRRRRGSSSRRALVAGYQRVRAADRRRSRRAAYRSARRRSAVHDHAHHGCLFGKGDEPREGLPCLSGARRSMAGPGAWPTYVGVVAFRALAWFLQTPASRLNEHGCSSSLSLVVVAACAAQAAYVAGTQDPVLRQQQGGARRRARSIGSPSSAATPTR